MSTIGSVTTSQEYYTPSPSTNTGQMIASLSSTKKESLVTHLKKTLSDHLGNAIDDTINHPNGSFMMASDYHGSIPFNDMSKNNYSSLRNHPAIQGVGLTSLKDSFLDTAGLFTDDITNDFQNEYSKIGKGESFTYTLEQLKNFHEYKKDIATTTPNLDPLVQDALSEVVKSDSNYVLGLELDMAETERLNELVFAIFEKDGEEEISRTLIYESQLWFLRAMHLTNQ